MADECIVSEYKIGESNMDKLLTIVIPSYNVETTLRQTVESMLVPNIKLRNMLDILIVNDGSKDGTLQLARQLEADNPGVVRVWNKENGGHGSTINVGIDHGYGKYMKVVDGDDWLETDALEKFLKALSETDADVVATDYYHYYMDSGKKEIVISSKLPYGKKLKFSDIENQYTFFMHSLAVKTNLMRNQPHRIDEHCYYVDVEYDTLAALVCETVLYLDLKLYVYRLSFAGQSVSVEGWIKHYKEHERVVLTLVDWYNKLASSDPKRTDKIAYAEKRIVRSAGGHYKIGLDFPKKEMKKFLKHLKEYNLKLKQTGAKVYELSKCDIVAKICMITNFSYFCYFIIGILKKIKKGM